MEKFQNLHAAILNRRRESAAYYYPDPWWEKEVAAITDDLKTAIEFIDADCSDEEVYWLGEVFEDIMDKTRSADFLPVSVGAFSASKTPNGRRRFWKTSEPPLNVWTNSRFPKHGCPAAQAGHPSF